MYRKIKVLPPRRLVWKSCVRSQRSLMIFFQIFWGSAYPLKDLLHWLGDRHCISYSDGSDRTPPHFLNVEIGFRTFQNQITCLTITRGEQHVYYRTNTQELLFPEVWSRFYEPILISNILLFLALCLVFYFSLSNFPTLTRGLIP